MRVTKFRLAMIGVAGALTFTAVGAGAAMAFQPHMAAARDDLNAAQVQLQQAAPDKAGHRVAALNLVQQAIDQVTRGIQAGTQ
jgi:hypothetical protein